MELLETVSPKSIPQFVGNKVAIKALHEFMMSSNPTKNILCLLGPDGSGKTILSHLIMDSHKKQVLELGKDILYGNDIQTVLHNFANNMTIESFMNKRQKVVFLDDLDILVNIDKMILSKILTANKLLKTKGIKILMSSNINDERRITDQPKEIEAVKLSYPFVKDTYVYIMRCFDDHSIDHDPQQLLTIVQKCKGNIRDSILNLNCSESDLSTKAQEATFKDMNNFEITRRILQNKCTSSDVETLIAGDPGVVPYMLYENLPDELDANYKFKKTKGSPCLIDMYMQVNKAFSEASAFEDKAYCSMDWQYLSYANMFKLYSVHSTISTVEKKATAKDVRYRFSQLLSKISHKNIMAKKVKTLSSTANVSSSSMIVATDAHARLTAKTRIDEPEVKSTTKKTSRSKKGETVSKRVEANEVILTPEETSIVNTYEKYFV